MLDFEDNHYSLFEDWQKNETKDYFTTELKKKVSEEKNALPNLLSNGDLRKRWGMDNRQSVHNVVKKNQFPDPILLFSEGKFPLYLEKEVLIYEINHPWVLTAESRLKYSHWILKNVINQ
ncbi:MAG: hypothetical protein L0J01_04465 [Tetragenococcus halophilus]|nr:hypothetical protein [Tetragenococcus halophilus]MDN6166447.1 hypothetical protein [Tetragenococcus koreensis]MDN6184906.1 hypothetical protein [Lactococcus lactis]MDN6640965.1 hypothetical protein [Tetragenococcus sp.]MDN6751052.1 hypothetical protein [Staphylococcus equorum]